MKQFNRIRKEKSMGTRVLYYHRLKDIKKFEKMQVRYIPEDVQFIPMTIYLYEGWVAIISFEALLGIEIHSYSIYNGCCRISDDLL